MEVEAFATALAVGAARRSNDICSTMYLMETFCLTPEALVMNFVTRPDIY